MGGPGSGRKAIAVAPKKAMAKGKKETKKDISDMPKKKAMK